MWRKVLTRLFEKKIIIAFISSSNSTPVKDFLNLCRNSRCLFKRSKRAREMHRSVYLFRTDRILWFAFLRGRGWRGWIIRAREQCHWVLALLPSSASWGANGSLTRDVLALKNYYYFFLFTRLLAEDCVLVFCCFFVFIVAVPGWTSFYSR